MRAFKLATSCFTLIVMAVFIAGCGQEVVTVPMVVSTSPVNGATAVAINTGISATFNMPMKPDSFTATTFQVTTSGGAAVAGTVSYSGTVATFTPSALLAFSTTYSATITTGAKNLGGIPLRSNYVWTFTTMASAPLVVSTIPANGAVQVPVNQLISAHFNEEIDPASITGNSFQVTAAGGAAVAGTLAYSGGVATFTPSTALAYATSYTATVTTAIKNLEGTSLAGNYVWSFTTVAAPPVVISTIPANGAVNVAIDQVVSARFSEVLNAASINGASFYLSDSSGGAVSGTVNYGSSSAGSVATFKPTVELKNNATYTATVTTGVANLEGTALQSNYVWSFTTITPPPTVIATVPTNGATGVPINQVLSATFNEAVICTTLSSPATTFHVAGPGGTVVAGTVACSGAAVTFTPSTPLAFNTLFTATITTAVKSLAGTPMAANYVWRFLTVPAPTPPTVISTVPLNGATGVPINQALTATFSVAMDPTTIDDATFTLSGPGGTAVTGTVTYTAAGSIATFKPTVALVSSSLYTATITTGARDLEGTALVANYVWRFTTAAAIDVTKPTVIATIPINNAIAVPVNQTVSATFSEAMDPATMIGANFTLKGPGTTTVTGLVAYAAISRTITFNPDATLLPSTVYTATITTGATDLAGNALAANYVWKFTTGVIPDTTPPEIVSTNPLNGAANLPTGIAVSAKFTEAMNPLTITTGTFQLMGPGNALIAATVAYDPVTFIATLTPTAPLAESTTYTATITGATDIAGNPLGDTGAPNPWSFSTGAVIVPPPVDLGTASLFAGFGGAAGMTNQGINTVINGDIGTTGVSTLITGFHDNGPGCVYTETPLNVGYVNGSIDTAAPPPTVGCPTEGTAITGAIAAQAAADALTAYNALVAFPNGLDVSVCAGCGGGNAGELGNRTLAPGIYKSAPGSYALSQGNLTLDAQGDANAFWVFQMGTTLTVGTPSSNRTVLLVNGAQAKNVFWQVGTAATINGVLGGGTMEGTIIAQAGVSISTAGVDAITTINGRALVLVGPVTMVNTVINVPAP